MEFLYVFSLMFLSIFGLTMLIKFLMAALLGDKRNDKDKHNKLN